MKELYEFYEKNKKKISNNSNYFKTFIEEVCNESSKELSSSIGLAFRKNSNEWNTNNMKNTIDIKTYMSTEKNEKVFLPKNNPLQEINLNFK
jgi:hypothetical protein